VFIVDSSSQLLKINTTTKKSGFINLKENNPGMNISCTNNKLFVSTNSSLSIMDINDEVIKKTFLYNKINNETINQNSIAFDNSGQLLVSLNNHLYEFDTSGNFKTEITDLNRNPVVNTGFINKVYSDKFKRIWLLDNDDIKRIQNVETPFLHFIYPDAKNNFVRSLYYDEQKHILLAGCFNGGIQLYDTLSNQLWKEPLVVQNVKDILSIEKLAPDKYLIITFGKGWYILNLSTKKINPFYFPASLESLIQPRSVSFTNNIQRINDNTILIATSQNIFKCVFARDKIISAAPLLPIVNPFQNQVDCFLYDKDKNLWIGISAGILYRVDENQQTKLYRIQGDYMVRTIVEGSAHNIWVGTDKGLFVYSQKGQLIKKISTETGLLNDCIYSLLPVKNSEAVFGASNLGLSFITLQDNIKNYSEELGLQSIEFNTASCVETKSGKLYFGGVDGVTSFYPNDLSEIKDIPGLYITRLVINDIPNNFSSGVQKGDSILLNYSQNHLQLDITAMGLLNPDEYIYKYRLNGFQNNWQVTHEPNNINYILEPGKYVLEIICSPNLSTNVFFKKDIHIIISPPWWQTWWFRLLAIIFFITIIVLIVHFYNRNKFNQKIKILQNKNEMQQERERISRDLHDNLGAQANALLYGTEQLQNSNPSETILVNSLNTTAKDMMISLRETIWVMKHNDAKASEIWFRIINFCNQLSLFYKEIKIETEGTLPEGFEFKSEKALHIILIIQEALNNAVRHSGAKRILIESNVQKNTWTIKVKDDGKGICKNENKQNPGGFGLNNMQERALIAKITLTIVSEEGKGTCITLNIPLDKKSE
ncbi:MAG: ATP-binding protein, partial [Ginsengibacter sp.]